MKHILAFLILILVCLPLKAQLDVNFNDSGKLYSGLWQLSDSAFIISNAELRSNSRIANSVSFISSAASFGDSSIWRLKCRMMFNPSSLNYTDFVLLADSSDLRKARNSVFVRLGGTSDEISVFVSKNGTESKLIDGRDGLLNANSNAYALRLVLLNDSLELTYTTLSGGIEYRESKAAFILPFSNGFTGIRVRQSTSSFFYKHFFDDLYAGPIVKDSLAPVCDSIIVSGINRVICYFNEACRPETLSDSTHFLLNSNQLPTEINVSHDKTKVELNYEQEFPVNKYSTLAINGIQDLSGNVLNGSSHQFFYSKPDTPRFRDILITEMMIDPEPSAGLPEKEYIEILNVSDKYLMLKGCRIADGLVSHLLPSVVLAPDSFLVLYKIPSLNNAADEIILSNGFGDLIHAVTYTDSCYRGDSRSEGGYSLEMIDIGRPCLGCINWRASKDISGGTPGKKNSVSEILKADSSAPELNGIDFPDQNVFRLFFNEALDTLSDIKWQFNGNVFKPVSIQFDKNRMSINCILPFAAESDSVYNFSFEGLRDCEGNISRIFELQLQWPSLSRKGDIVINEILFNPRSGGSDFVELYNCSKRTFDLSKLFLADLDNGGLIKQIYPLAEEFYLFKPGMYMLLTEDTADVCTKYKCGRVSGLSFQIKNMPSLPDEEGKIVLLNILGEYTDSLSYRADWHYPMLNDRNGVSLERLSTGMNSNDVYNWHSASGISGFASPARQNSVFIPAPATDKYFNVSSRTLSPDLDGYEDLMIISYKLPDPDFAAVVKVFDISGRLVLNLMSNQTLGTEGAFTWDGTDETGTVQAVGIYIILIECRHPDGRVINEKLSVVLAARF